MSEIEKLVTRMFGFGFDGGGLADDARELIKRGAGAAILFARNVKSPEQIAELGAEIKNTAGRPLPIGIDQEGGRVMRLREGFTAIPSMRAIGRVGDETLAQKIGEILGREVRAVNIDIDFAPCVDVDTNPANPVIADRSFGPDPALVSRMGCAVLRCIQSQGVAACAKHFPGHGDTAQDSHKALPRLPHAMDRLQRIELPPFKAAIDAGVASIMTNHVIFEPLDRDFPTTMSRACLDGILRDQMHFDGVVFSDDLEMKAIADHYGLDQAVIRGANAGVDLFWICHHADQVHRGMDALIKAVERGEVSRARIEEANRRLDTLNAKYCQPPRRFDNAQLNRADGCTIVDEIRRRIDASLLGTGIDPTDFMKMK